MTRTRKSKLMATQTPAKDTSMVGLEDSSILGSDDEVTPTPISKKMKGEIQGNSFASPDCERQFKHMEIGTCSVWGC